jgi:hypothetical protein
MLAKIDSLVIDLQDVGVRCYTITPVGYAIEIHLEGVPVEISNAIAFEKYRDENTLEKFKQQAEEKSGVNKGVLVPAHHIFPNYFQKGAYLLPPILGN